MVGSSLTSKEVEMLIVILLLKVVILFFTVAIVVSIAFTWGLWVPFIAGNMRISYRAALGHLAMCPSHVIGQDRDGKAIYADLCRAGCPARCAFGNLLFLPVILAAGAILPHPPLWIFVVGLVVGIVGSLVGTVGALVLVDRWHARTGGRHVRSRA